MDERERSRSTASAGYLVLPLTLLIVALILVATGAQAAAADGPEAAWLEPRGISIVDLVGKVPESDLAGAIISYADVEGIVLYDSGERVGNRVVVSTTIYPRIHEASWVPNGQLTLFTCLGQAPMFDQMGTVVPASALRVYTPEGVDITEDIHYFQVTVMDQSLPLAGSGASVRYPIVGYGPGQPNPLPPITADGLEIPANSGCSIGIPGVDYRVLKGVFTFDVSPEAQVAVVGTQQATFHSYIGVGWNGVLQHLMDQMAAKFGDRHERIPLAIPARADYFLLRFPPTPVDAYTDQSIPPYANVDRPIGGTYRLVGSMNQLSADLVMSAGFPLVQAWQDADEAPGSQYLPTFRPIVSLATPEYVVPAGIGYSDCFISGACPDSLLQAIYDAEMELEIVYLDVTPLTWGEEWVPVRMAGPAWWGGAGAASAPAVVDVQLTATDTFTTCLPLVIKTVPEPVPPIPGPAGWFDPIGRMLGFFPGP